MKNLLNATKKITSIILIIFSLGLFAQEEIDTKLTHFNQEKLDSIDLIKANLVQTKNKIENFESLLKNEKDSKQKILIEGDLKRVKDRYNKLKLNLISVITDIKIEEIQKDELNKKRDYLQEAQELLGPAFDTIQRISERPRKIEALRKELKIYQNKLAITQLALKNIEVVKSSQEFKSLLPDMESFLYDATYNVNDLNQEFTVKIERINRELQELTKDNQTLVGAFTELSKEFFSNKGKHLGISFLLFITIIWTLTVLKNKVVLNLLKKSQVEWFYKPISALYGVFTFITALVFSILSLYLMGDWVLVTLIVLILSAILWGSKSYIHKYLAEGRLILNLGTIKEGELVIFRGIPWKVKTINFVTIFENEYLDSSNIRIEISQIFQMHSRKILPDEQWFPTRTQDWVLLSDGTFGQIKSQTVEQIVIEIRESQRKYLTTTDYLSLRPTNLSHGYTITFNWGLDYRHQSILMTEIIPLIQKELGSKLIQNYQGIEKVMVDLDNAAASSLNLFVELKLNGSLASMKLEIEREAKGILLQICHQNRFEVPFNQLVIHQKENHHHFSK